MVQLSGFITNLGKYNEGELVGEWVEFPLTDDEYEEACKRIGIDDEYEEVFWTDWECDIDGVSDALGEYVSYEDVNELVEEIENIYDDDKVAAIIEVHGIEGLSHADDMDYIPYDSLGEYMRNNHEGLGYYIIDEIDGGIENVDKDTLERYFDYESFGRDCAFDYYETDNGFLSHY